MVMGIDGGCGTGSDRGGAIAVTVHGVLANA